MGSVQYFQSLSLEEGGYDHPIAIQHDWVSGGQLRPDPESGMSSRCLRGSMMSDWEEALHTA